MPTQVRFRMNAGDEELALSPLDPDSKDNVENPDGRVFPGRTANTCSDETSQLVSR